MTTGPQRTELLDATIDSNVERAQLTRIELAPGQAPGAHHHPCDVVGLVVSGEIRFQIEGAGEVLLRAGDAFFEPRNVYVVHFDNASRDEPAVFVACYLLAPGVSSVIEMTPPPH